MTTTIHLSVVGDELRAILREVEYAAKEMERMATKGRAHEQLLEAQQVIREIRGAILGDTTRALEPFGLLAVGSVLPTRAEIRDAPQVAARILDLLRPRLIALHELLQRLERETPGSLLAMLLTAVGTEMLTSFGRIADDLEPVTEDSHAKIS